MNILIHPSTARGTLTAPPSKSMAHRLLICGGLAEGESVIDGIAPSEDVLATLDCLSAIGAAYRYENDTVTITGIGKSGVKPCAPLECRECGSTLRFFIPILFLTDTPAVFHGSERLLSRPLTVYADLAAEKGLLFENNGREIRTQGRLQSGVFTIPGNISSQFISGLLFTLPLLDGDSRIVLTNGVESRSYIGLTLSALSAFGVNAFWETDNTLLIPGGQRYRPCRLRVEGDYSNAAFFDAFNYLGGEVKIDGLSSESTQGDRVYRDYFPALAKGFSTLSITDCPDLGPILFTVAALSGGGRFTGTDRLKIKESDRGAAMAEELAKCGVRLHFGNNEITVDPADLHAPRSLLSGHNDHRIVMALSVLLTRLGGVIGGCEAVAKSLPDFFERLSRLGIAFEEVHP